MLSSPESFNQVMRLHSGDCEDRNLIQLGVIKTGQEIGATGTGRGKTNTEPASPFGIGRRHEGSGLFMSDLNKPYRILTFAKRLHDAIDAISRKAKYRVDLPVDQCLYQHVCCGLHDQFLSLVRE
ncbi:hypothetical protein ASB65_16695 [Agrobacterium tumefaciens str. B6]|nr:hypothetical protein ASB65_16695 [Agrobacterium tumefaciens str. B6]OCJ39460.1 hypothetical protein A6U90_19260 [Agrobacterium tumefaciens]